MRIACIIVHKISRQLCNQGTTHITTYISTHIATPITTTNPSHPPLLRPFA